jgi:hypothetical protein
MSEEPAVLIEDAAIELNLPPGLMPRMIVCLGHAAPPADQMPMCAPKVTWRDLTHWELHKVAEGGPRG